VQLLVQPDAPHSSPVQITVQQQQQQQSHPMSLAAATAAGTAAAAPGSSRVCNVRAIQQANLAAQPAMQLMLAQAATPHQVSSGTQA
jgi:hypothetical protein